MVDEAPGMTVHAEENIVHRWRWFGLVLILGMLVYFVGGYLNLPSVPVRTGLKILIATGLLGGWLITRRSPQSKSLSGLLRDFGIASMALLFTWLVGLAFEAIGGADITTIQGVAIYKLIDSLPIVVCIIVLNRATGGSLKDLYLGKGRLWLGLTVGLTCFAIWVVVFLLMAQDAGIALSQVRAWSGWILLFIFSNAFMEELHFRGLVLGPLGSMLGKNTANLAIAVYFTLIHAPVQYAPDIVVFLVILFFLSLVWGFLTQWTRALWASVLFHAGADLTVVVGFLSNN